LHAIARADVAVDIFTLDTGRIFPETLETIETSEQHYGRKIALVTPASADVEALTARDGVLGFRQSIAARKSCCHVRKVEPLGRRLAGAGAWITGMRRGQAATRTTVPFAAWDATLGLIKLSPLADWDSERLDAYLREHTVPVNTLHARGFPSIGCQPCTRAIRPGEDIRAGRWWWEAADGRECGLHTRPKAVATVL
jgi:phosphoadenosine phosphosulfate reductase